MSPIRQNSVKIPAKPFRTFNVNDFNERGVLMTQVSRRDFLRFSGITAAGLAAISTGSPFGTMSALASPTTQQVSPFSGTAFLANISPELHVLNRLTWGARPQDRDRIREIGIEAYIDWQLDYANIPDPLVDDFLSARRILSMPLDELRPIADNQYEYVLTTALWARMYRAIYSERQLYERLVEFWTDHFNIPIYDLLAGKIDDDRRVARTQALGKFRDLLFASAQSPAMLDYLDNDVSTYEHPNENYARELMELHTLGVDGGYTEQDVVEVARALTGWTIREGWDGYSTFDPSMHDTDAKTVLGVTLPAGRGIEDGLQVLDILARHPSTARFISTKLIRRFVSDAPPASLVDSTAQVFTETDGDIRLVMRHILLSGEFMQSAGLKFRRPLDYLTAVARSLAPGLQLENGDGFFYILEPLGHVPYGWQPPNGYPDVAGAWINTNALLHRWNAALSITLSGEGYLPGVALNLDRVIPPAATAAELVNSVIANVLGFEVAAADRDQFIAYVSANPDEPLTDRLRLAKLPGLVGIVLASPYFQWH
jgi:hypothetical protein